MELPKSQWLTLTSILAELACIQSMGLQSMLVREANMEIDGSNVWNTNPEYEFLPVKDSDCWSGDSSLPSRNPFLRRTLLSLGLFPASRFFIIFPLGVVSLPPALFPPP